MDAIKELHSSLRSKIFQTYIDKYSTYEERIHLKVLPKKIDLQMYEKMISPCLKVPRTARFSPSKYEIVLKQKRPQGLPMLGKLLYYVIGRDEDAKPVITTAHRM